MTEYGVFNDEGCLSAQHYQKADAEAEAAGYRADGDEHVYVAAVCPDHEEQPSGACEECFADG